MKKLILIAIMLISTVGLFAQEKAKTKEPDTLKIKWGTSKIWIFEDAALAKPKDSIKAKYENRDFAHWAGIDLGICMLSTANNKFQIPQEKDAYNVNYFLDLKYNRSWDFALNIFEKPIKLYRNNIMFVTGLGAEWNSYCFRKNILLDSDADKTNSTSISIDTASNKNYIKNDLKAFYAKVPLLLEFNTNGSNPNKSFHIAAGMEVAYKLDSWTKQKYEIDGTTYKNKHHDDYNVAPLKYGFTLRAGYGKFTLFANYALSPLFDLNKGPEEPLYPLSVGVQLIGF